MANVVSVPARMSIGSVASQMESMRIIAKGFEEKSHRRQHFQPASSL
ncbi:hypothetical protein ALQ39_03346 [Pseudomonas amygdali pv. eriobotryae]|uniref:Uncharacterized protein n=1 Tax=Pseudomonas amygdali pv. eriobotryae TaxID=129137 RepID=A0A3M3W364_PSEA0|nr:hypothetical protein ALQ39_03346 [Pseudomonas amygdali pv. eriobotryae]